MILGESQLEDQSIGCTGRSGGGDYHTKDSPPLSPNFKSSHSQLFLPDDQLSNNQTSISVSAGGKPKNIEIGFPDNNSKSRTEFCKKHNHTIHKPDIWTFGFVPLAVNSRCFKLFDKP